MSSSIPAHENTTFYRVALSTVIGFILGVFGLIAGAVWALALDGNVPLVAAIVGAVAAMWGMVACQLTPTGGVIMENKTTVNYAVIALHGWLTFIACIIALIVWAVRAVV